MTTRSRRERDRQDGGARPSAAYIAELVDELAKMARNSNHEVLGYLLDIASLEARTIARREGQAASPSGDD